MKLSRLLNQTATYWGSPEPDGYGGLRFAAPVVIAVRWEDRIDLFLDADGNERRSQGRVYSTYPLENNAFIMLGDQTSTTSTTSTGTSNATFTPSHRAWQIKRVDQTPSLDGDQTLYKAFLG